MKLKACSLSLLLAVFQYILKKHSHITCAYRRSGVQSSAVDEEEEHRRPERFVDEHEAVRPARVMRAQPHANLQQFPHVGR
jgi:hypothetical protein